MPTYVTREEFEAFKRELTGEVTGEKAVTRHILEQTQRNGGDLATVKARLDHVAGDMAVMKADFGRHGRMLDVLAQDVRQVRGAIDTLGQQVGGLIASLPGIVAEAVRAANRNGG